MKSYLILVTITISLNLYAQTALDNSKGLTKSHAVETTREANYTYIIISSENKTWGYDIYMGKRLFIHPPCVPGLPGNEGFKTKADAEKVGRLVIEKIKKGEMPPTVTIEEMKKIKVIYTKK
jgi:hypothetical protein